MTHRSQLDAHLPSTLTSPYPPALIRFWRSLVRPTGRSGEEHSRFYEVTSIPCRKCGAATGRECISDDPQLLANGRTTIPCRERVTDCCVPIRRFEEYLKTISPNDYPNRDIVPVTKPPS